MKTINNPAITRVLTGMACGAIMMLAITVGIRLNATATGFVALGAVALLTGALLAVITLNPDKDIRPDARVLTGLAGTVMCALTVWGMSSGLFVNTSERIPYVISQDEPTSQLADDSPAYIRNGK